jgi:hypothetical protein
MVEMQNYISVSVFRDHPIGKLRIYKIVEEMAMVIANC